MEALAAVGIAANVLQFIQFGLELFRISSVIRKNGEQPVGHLDLETIAQSLESHSKSLAGECNTSGLKALADQANSVATELSDAINKIKKKSRNHKTGQPGRWDCFRQALGFVWKESTIQKIVSRLEAIRDQLQFHLIVETRNAQTSLNDSFVKLTAEMHQENNKFPTTSQENINLSEMLEKILDNLSLISKHLSTERICPPSVDQEVVALQKSTQSMVEEILERKTHAILKSLTFSSMTVRKTKIVKAHRETFKWVFMRDSLSEADPRRKVTLSDWLENGEGIYWITGKPGSGKSTLMKFLEAHQSTLDLLRQWAGNQRLIRASFYFWNAGTEMQKSVEGLLQSLLYTILSSRPDLVPVLCPERCISTDRQTVSEWSLAELQDVFKKLQLLRNVSTKFYLHIDGLDEYSGDPYNLIKIIDDLAQHPNYKICVSSRPWNQFLHTIGKSSHGSLQLHLYTKEDIEKFARECLMDRQTEFRSRIDQSQYNELVSEIGHRAQGVFLWVRLVVHSLREGQSNSDPVSLLRKRLEEIPTDLEEFFQQILQSVSSVYGERMARTFLTALASPEPLKLIHYSLLDEEDPYMGWSTTLQPMDHNEIADRCVETRWRLNGRYKGLLEPASDEESYHITVDFLHRTLRDFLVTPRIKTFLESRVPHGFDPLKAIIGVLLGEVKSLNSKMELRHFVDAAKFAAAIDSFLQTNLIFTSDVPLTYQLIDHVDQLIPSIYTESLHTTSQLTIMVRAAVRYRQDAYVKYRLITVDRQSDLDWLLHIILSRPNVTARSFDSILGQDIETLFLPDHKTVNALLGKNPNINEDLISDVLEKGADLHAQIEDTTIWNAFLKTFEMNMSVGNSAYWPVLKHLVQHGAKVDLRLSMWIRLATRISSMDQWTLGEFFMGIIYILEQGMKADTNLWIKLLYEMDTERIPSSFWTLMTTFLRRGADVAGITSIPLTSEPEPKTWFCKYLSILQKLQKMIFDRGGSAIFEVFFQHGLDPNQRYRESTMWIYLLRTIAKLEYCWEHAYLIKTFLQYGADPTVKILHHIVKTKFEHDCPSEPESLESWVRLTIDIELRELQQRDKEAFQHRTMETRASHESAMHNATTIQRGNPPTRSTNGKRSLSPGASNGYFKRYRR